MAAEIAKLAADELRLKELEIQLVAQVAEIADVENKIKELADTDGGSFRELSAFQQRRLKSPENYFDSLEKNRKQLHLSELALRNQLQGASQLVHYQRRIVADLKTLEKARTEYILVRGRLLGARGTKGIRRYVYSAASNNAGSAAADNNHDGDDETPPHRAAIRYVGKDLCFDILFLDRHDAALFCNEALPIAFGYSPRRIVLSPPEDVSVLKAVQIHPWDYRSEDEADSACSGDEDSTIFSAVDPDSDLARFQSIERAQMVRGDLLDVAHLVHKWAIEAQEIEDNENNRLALAPTFHRMFDGLRVANVCGQNWFPKLMIEPAPDFPAPLDSATVTDSRGMTRERVWVKVSTFEVLDCEVLSLGFKEGTQSVKAAGGFTEYFTFVYVTDRDEFYSNLEWKAAETRSIWEDARSRR